MIWDGNCLLGICAQTCAQGWWHEYTNPMVWCVYWGLLQIDDAMLHTENEYISFKTLGPMVSMPADISGSRELRATSSSDMFIES